MTLKTILAAATLAALGTGLAAQEVKIGIAAEPYPPFASLDSSGTWVGWEVDVIDAAFRYQPLRGCTEGLRFHAVELQ